MLMTLIATFMFFAMLVATMAELRREGLTARRHPGSGAGIGPSAANRNNVMPY